MADTEYRPDVNLDSGWWVLALTLFIGILFGGKWLSEFSNENVRPFYAPLAVGVLTCAVLKVGLSIWAQYLNRAKNGDSTDGDPDESLARNLKWIDWAIIAPLLVFNFWFLGMVLFPKAYEQSLIEPRSDAAFWLGLFGLIIVSSIFRFARDLFSNKVLK